MGVGVDLPAGDVRTVRGGVSRVGRGHSHGDRGMAMSLAVAALRAEGVVTIEDAECVAKSYPEFFEDLESIRIR